MSHSSKTKVAFKSSQASARSIANPPSMKNLSKRPSFAKDEPHYADFDGIKKKHDKIASLEGEISRTQRRLTEFYFKMKEVLEKDPVLDYELKQIFFNESLREHILECDSGTLIDFIEKIMIGAINLSHSLAGLQARIPNLTNDSDYVLILQKLEEEILLLKQRQIEDEFVIEALKLKIDELQEQNRRIIDKSAQTAQSFKQDYYKLLTIIHELEYDLDLMKGKINEKDAEIHAVNEKNFSIFVLEHKIKSLDMKYRKDISKARSTFTREIKFIKDARLSDPNYYHRVTGVEAQIRDLGAKLCMTERKTTKLEEDKKSQITELNSERTTLEKTINELKNEIFGLRERLADKNKDLNLLRGELLRKSHEYSRLNNPLPRSSPDETVTANKKLGKSFNTTTINNTTTFNKTWGVH